MNRTAGAIVCGAGIIGIACAWHLAARFGVRRVAIVDERPPLSLTSDKSTECYRHWWPGPGDAMVSLMNRSVDLLEELAEASDNRFNMNRRGYLFATADPERAAVFEAAGREADSLGAGPLRCHDGSGGDEYLPHRPDGYAGMPDGADLIVDDTLIRRHFPWISPDAVAVLHARRCGWLSAQQLGMYLLEEARRHGGVPRQRPGGRGAVRRRAGHRGRGSCSGMAAKSESGRRSSSTPRGPSRRRSRRGSGRTFRSGSSDTSRCPFRTANGRSPGTRRYSSGRTRSGSRGPKKSARPSRTTRRDAPFSRPFRPGRTDARMVGRTPRPSSSTGPTRRRGGARPSSPSTGTRATRRLCSAACRACSPPSNATSAAFRGPGSTAATTSAPGRTAPLVGPLPLEGSFVCSAFSGFGIMGSCAGAELLAAHVTGASLPPWAGSFTLARYDDPAYRDLLDNWPDDGQL